MIPTTYTYDTTSGQPDRLTTVAPPGLEPWTISYSNYTNNPGQIAAAQVTSIARTHNSTYGGGTEQTSFVYGANISSTTSSDYTHPDLSSGRLAIWGEDDAPVAATAVFPPGTTASTSDLRPATVYAMDTNGQQVNTANFSGTNQAGWNIAMTQYDTYGNVIQTLSPVSLNASIADNCNFAGLPSGCSTVGVAIALSTYNDYDYSTSNPAGPGVELDDVFAPAVDTYGNQAGEGYFGRYREHTHYTYGNDTSPPSDPTTNGPVGAVTSMTVGVSRSAWPNTTSETDDRTTTYAYGLSPSDETGWALQEPESTTVSVPGGSNVVTQTRYDPVTGNTIESRQPSAAGTSSSPAATEFTYFTAGTTNNAGCVNTAWVGLLCKQAPGAQPTTSGLAQLPVTTYTYDYLGRPLTKTETVTDASNNIQTRTTTTTYDGSGWADRVYSTAISSTVGTAVPTVTDGYSSTTGLPTTVNSGTGSLGGTVTTGYDDFGNVVTYTDADGAVTTTTYNAASEVASVTNKDSGSNTINAATYGYGANNEYRELPTSVTYGNSVGTFTADYNADGALLNEYFPNGMSENFTLDSLDRPMDKNYYDSAGLWSDEEDGYTAQGQVSWHGGDSSIQGYQYDGDGRLTQVQETRGSICVTRVYGYDVDSNRTAYNQYPAGSTGSCTTATTPSPSQANTFDNADRLTASNGSTPSYDAFGRTTSVPASLSAGGTAATSVSYYANDMANSIGQSGTTKTYTLDPESRIRNMTVSGSSTASLDHYGTDGDSPAWSLETNSSGSTSDMAYDIGLDGDLAAITSNAGGSIPAVSYQLMDLHGDVEYTTTPAGTTAPNGSAFDPDEFGNERTTSGGATASPRYGWLGADQRSSDTEGGLMLMGARLYSPTEGSFLSTDPILGGNAGPYEYPSDPVASSDVTGLSASWCLDVNDDHEGMCAIVFGSGLHVSQITSTYDREGPESFTLGKQCATVTVTVDSVAIGAKYSCEFGSGIIVEWALSFDRDFGYPHGLTFSHNVSLCVGWSGDHVASHLNVCVKVHS